jgi:hypothetical protein
VNTEDLFPLVGAALIALIIALLIVWLGFKLLFLPLRIVSRFGRSLALQFRPAVFTLLLVWTVALEPGPFLYLWEWFLRFGKAILIDTPTVIIGLTPSIVGCSAGNVGVCLTSIGSLFQQLLSTVQAPVAAFTVPPNLDRAALIFAIGMTIATAITKLPQSNSIQSARYSARDVTALTASFALALYLCIISIIAIPVFGQKVPDITPYAASLADQLTKAAPLKDDDYPAILQLEQDRAALPDKLPLPTVDAEHPDRSTSSLGNTFETYWDSQLNLWNQSHDRLHEAATTLPKEALSFAHAAESFFQISNEGHIGEIVTQRHVTVLVNSFNLWMSDYKASIDSCTANLNDDIGKFHAFYSNIGPITQALSSTENANNITAISNIFKSLTIEPCSNLKLAVRDYLPGRAGPEETLGPFGVAAAWLLRTESPELALIIGLLGFGFFGALAASFIRELAGATENQLPSLGFLVPALIRGMGAAILVFLLAKGGTAILTRGDATPNAYAIFFACFVAAVFSDDVWLWARARQRGQFPEVADEKSNVARQRRRKNTKSPTPQNPPIAPPDRNDQ